MIPSTQKSSNKFIYTKELGTYCMTPTTSLVTIWPSWKVYKNNQTVGMKSKVGRVEYKIEAFNSANICL